MDYFSVLNIKPKYKGKYIFITFILVGLFIFILNLNIYDTLQLKGLVKNDYLLINLPIKYSDTLLDGKFLKINNQKYSYRIVNISPLKIDESTLIEYQTIEIKVSRKSYPNEIINFAIYTQKEKLFKKLKRCLERS